MQIQSQTPQTLFVLPGSCVTKQKLSYNSNCFYQHKRRNEIVALKYGQPMTKQLLSSSSATQKSSSSQPQPSNKSLTLYQQLLHFPYVYEPQKGDLVIGVIKMKSSEFYIVDINSALDGVLGSLEFDGATKRNKPNIQQGALVYCRITEHSKHMGSKLSCFNKGFSVKNQMGELHQGMQILVPRFKHLAIEQKLELIAKYLKFEIAFGKNGVIWFKSGVNTHMIVLYNVLNQLVAGADAQLITQILEASKN